VGILRNRVISTLLFILPAAWQLAVTPAMAATAPIPLGFGLMSAVNPPRPEFEPQLLGSITEFAIPTPDALPEGITLGPDGALWFAEYNVGNIGRISTSGQVSEYPIGRTLPEPTGIAAGSDGALWFNERSLNDPMGRITTSGQITEYFSVLTYQRQNITAITAGPDGALWFAENDLQNSQCANSIGRIDTSGQVTKYTIPQPAGQCGSMVAITTGPDGALWSMEYVSSSATNIWRTTTSGQFAQYPIAGVFVATTNAIAAGPDAALWFTTSIPAQVWRISTTGATSQYRVSGMTDAEGITLGPDGALWFTYQTKRGKERIGRIDVRGKVKSVANPSRFVSLEGITAGPGATLWFTELSGDKIGRLSLK
jgi:virginiamycin B lyase